MQLRYNTFSDENAGDDDDKTVVVKMIALMAMQLMCVIHACEFSAYGERGGIADALVSKGLRRTVKSLFVLLAFDHCSVRIRQPAWHSSSSCCGSTSEQSQLMQLAC